MSDSKYITLISGCEDGFSWRILTQVMKNGFFHQKGQIYITNNKEDGIRRRDFISICENCGEVRKVRKNDYSSLCRKCTIVSEEFKEKQRKAKIGKNLTESHKQKIREGLIKNFTNPKERERISKLMSKENNPRWLGGISFEPYCPLFDENFKERVREFFNRTCYLCGRTETEQMNEMLENGKRAFRLAVHHVGNNKDTCCDDSLPLFVPLCIKCHSKTNKDRNYWEKYFTGQIMKDYNGKCFISKKTFQFGKL